VSSLPVSPWARRPEAAARAGFLAVLVLAPVAAGLGGLVRGGDGVRGAALGTAVPGLVLAMTWLATWIGRAMSGPSFALLLVVSYALRLLAVVVLLSLVQGRSGVDREVLGATAATGLLLAITVEAAVTARTRAPYVDI